MPVNTSNKYVFNVTCEWYIDVATNSINSLSNGSSTCGAAASNWDCCTSVNPCIAGDGNCHSDSECESGLTCGFGNCGPGFPTGFSCCVAITNEVVVDFDLQAYEVRSFIFIYYNL